MADNDTEKQKLDESEAAEVSTQDTDDPKVKFINGKSDGDVAVDVPSSTGSTTGFVGLSKAELEKYANDPFWVKCRYILFIGFWVIWLIMLVAAIVIIVLAPKCPPRPDLKWWQKDIVYQVYPQSFKDGNNDNGIGDIKGIQDSLGYLSSLKVKTLWINSMYLSPMVDNGQDVTDHKEICPMFGTKEEFVTLLASMHKRGMHMILDFIPNHTSKNSTWFQESRQNKTDYQDYYIWSSGGGRTTPPNNWLSKYGHRAWTWDDVRGQWYYHTYTPSQPDLNLRNPAVQKELEDILKYWLDFGVDGFYVSSVSNLVESADLSKNEPPSNNTDVQNPEVYEYLSHPYTTNLPESYELVAKWQAIVDSYTNAEEKPRPRAMFVEASGSVDAAVNYFKVNSTKVADVSVNTNLLKVDSNCGGKCTHDLVEGWRGKIPSGKQATVMLGNDRTKRVATRKTGYTNAVNILLLLLPGTPFSYYGDEIGMTDGEVSWEQTKDEFGKTFGESSYEEYSRDFERTPMQWSSDAMAGFTEFNSTWLPVAADFKQTNVQQQMSHGAGKTALEVYMEVAELRQKPSFQWGKMFYSVVTDNLFSFVREAEGFPGYLVSLNLGSEIESGIKYSGSADGLVPSEGLVVGSTNNFDNMDFKNGTLVSLDQLQLKPGQGVVFYWPAKDPE